MKISRQMYIHVELLKEEAKRSIPLTKVFNRVKERYIQLFGLSSYALSMVKFREIGENECLFSVEVDRLKEIICALTLVDGVDGEKVSLFVRGVARTARGAMGK